MDEQMNNNGYQSQPNPMPNQNKDNYAVAILVLGIVSICCCAPCGIVALALRASSINDISPEKQGMVTAGFVTSIIYIRLVCMRLNGLKNRQERIWEMMKLHLLQCISCLQN